MVNILTINSILVNIDIISGRYVNGSTQPTIYSFLPNGNGLYLKKEGSVCQIETDGKGLYLGPTSGKGFETVREWSLLDEARWLYDGGLILGLYESTESKVMLPVAHTTRQCDILSVPESSSSHSDGA